MRCKNCGWPNRPGVTECSKCGAPITEESPHSMGGMNNEPAGYRPTEHGTTDEYGNPANPRQATVPDAGFAGGRAGGREFQAAATVREDVVFGPAAMSEPVERIRPADPPIERKPTAEARLCTKCGYPLREGSSKCPNCNYDPGNEAPQEQERKLTRRVDQPVQRRPTRMESPEEPEMSQRKQARPARPRSGGNKPINGTVNPYANPFDLMNLMPDPIFTIKPLKRMNERHEPEEVEMEGSEVVLNRDNIDPKNPSITSHEQAVITYDNEQFFIEDLSEQGTTFVRASSKIELHDGDIILMGNRLFEFHIQQ